MAQHTGKVVWFDSSRGYGFIGHKGRPDVFCDFQKLQVDGYRSLNTGDLIEFDIDDGPTGSQAINVKRLPAARADTETDDDTNPISPRHPR